MREPEREDEMNRNTKQATKRILLVIVFFVILVLPNMTTVGKGTNQNVLPKIVFDGVEVEFADGKGIFSTNFHNVEAALTKSLEIETTITNRQTKEIIYESLISDAQMVPHSSFFHQVKVSEEELTEGIYIIDYVVRCGEVTWEFRNHVRIVGETELKGYALSTGEVILLENGYFMLITGALLAILVGFALVYTRHWQANSNSAPNCT